MTAAERKILFFASSAHFLTHFFMLVFPALVMPVSRDLGLPLAQVVNMSFWSYLLYGVLATAWGALSDRIGHKWALASGLMLSGAGLMLAGSFPSPELIAFSFALVGVGSAAYHPSGLALISQGMNQRGRALGINGIWGNIGIAVVPFTVGLLNYLIGWQKGLVILGLLGVLLGAVGLITPFGVRRGDDRQTVEPVQQGTALPLLVTLAFALVFTGLMYRSFTVILPAFLEYRLGDIAEGFRMWVLSQFTTVRDVPAFNTLVANLVATGIYVLGIFGQGIGGRIADRYSLKWSYFVFFALALPFVIATAWISSAWLIPAAGMFMLFSLGMQPVENSLVAYLTPARWRSVSYGVKFTLTFGTGAFAIKLAGWLERTYGLAGVIWSVAGFVALVLVCVGVFLIISRGQAFKH